MGESVAFPYLACLILRTASGCDIVAVKFPGACPGFPDFKTSLTKFFLEFGKVKALHLLQYTGLQPIPTPLLWVNAVSLAVFPTVISLVTMTKAIHYIGSTPTAILGALEPVTALFFGVLIFGEQLTPRIILGILMVITAVTLIIGGKTLLKKSKIRLRHTGR